MGNQHGKVVIDGEQYEAQRAHQMFTQMKNDLDMSQVQSQLYEKQILELKEQLASRSTEVSKLKEELDKVKSVLQQKVMRGKPDILATVQEEVVLANQITRKKQGVSGESSTLEAADITLKHFEKDLSSKHLIKTALRNNDFLKNLDKSQVHEIVNCMYEERVQEGNYIIKENEAGDHFYVSAEGTLQVLKNDSVLGEMQPGQAFGELAILYGCTRTASIKAVKDAKIWALERKVFQAIMMHTGIKRQKERMEFLKSVTHLKNLSGEKLAKIADLLEADLLESEQYIVREGEVGDTFYIISDGKVKVTQKVLGFENPKEIRELGRGEYFGEKALLNEDRRTANVIACHPGVELLTLNREAFTSLIGGLTDIDYRDGERLAKWKADVSSNGLDKGLPIPVIDAEFRSIQMSDLDIISTLGIGGFGRVELVQHKKDKTKTFALKSLKKQHVVETRQQDHIFSEKRVMMTCRSPYIVRVYKTFKDKKFVYMLMEVCLGGELWTILRDMSYFDDNTARFAVACVIKALQYLHSLGIIYRDLKPENLLVTRDGYVKLVDFGFAKYVPAGKKTWTFCGTPEYVAPEIILNKGHDHAVDVWAIGILIFELTTGLPPFAASDPMKTYNIILKGIDALDFPKKVSKNAQNIIKRLCRTIPSDRLGYQKNGLSDIMKHKWFQGFDWEGLEKRNMATTPLKRKVIDNFDTSNFDRYNGDVTMPPDELSGWDDDF
ncbi:cGMP-dependent protein kinase 1-like [Watersipora subatra]|uniref:cGMP-dependent protein kinase 1-like n=1 Tax=Watersipora subatra TaxID=2589382 RepID=UPI00355B1066